jgi:hypothetical protein
VQCRAVLLTPSFSDNVRSCACLIPIVNASLSIVPIPLSRPLFATYLLLLPLSPHPTLCAPFSRTRRLSSPSHPGRPSQTLAARTPFTLQEGQVEVARMLIERGADVTAQNKDGETPLHLASKGDK